MATSKLRARTRRRAALAAVLLGGVWYLLHNPAVLRLVLLAFLGLTATAAWIRHRRIVRSRRRLRSLGDLLALTPTAFEAAVADLLARSGYRRAELCGGPADLGADIFCEDRCGRTIVVQCKRHAPGIAVGSGEIQRFMGTVTHHQVDRGIFVTTSRFTKPAADLAAEHDIELMDGRDLARLALRLNSRTKTQAPA
ncbi:MAG: restriction endonuclease [Actinomycetota bacterium]